jgi:hypothetical protein
MGWRTKINLRSSKEISQVQQIPPNGPGCGLRKSDAQASDEIQVPRSIVLLEGCPGPPDFLDVRHWQLQRAKFGSCIIFYRGWL